MFKINLSQMLGLRFFEPVKLTRVRSNLVKVPGLDWPDRG
jgi:hypothetical protein